MDFVYSRYFNESYRPSITNRLDKKYYAYGYFINLNKYINVYSKILVVVLIDILKHIINVKYLKNL